MKHMIAASIFVCLAATSNFAASSILADKGYDYHGTPDHPANQWAEILADEWHNVKNHFLKKHA